MQEFATFGAGCFWGVEVAFANVPGVKSTVVGYTGGRDTNPTYRAVCRGNTGHTEAVRVEFDPRQVKYEELLETFWACHDPTQLHRQGPDIGYQYRSVIFCEDDSQQALAESSKDRMDRSGRFLRPIATAIESGAPFYPAEEYHQKYLVKRGLATCSI